MPARSIDGREAAAMLPNRANGGQGRIARLLKREKFDPRLIGLVANPYFLIRRALHQSIAVLAPQAKGRILDFGCGSKPYRHLFDHAEAYIGLDVGESGHDHKNSEVDVFYDGKTIPFDASSFDAVVSFETFEHVFNLEEMLAEIRRVLRPGGTLLFSVPFAWDEHEAPYDFARYTSFAVPHLLARAGYEVVELRKSGNYVRSIAQLWIAYLHQEIGVKLGPLRPLIQLGLIFPTTLLGLGTSKILPRSDALFHNLVILARKPDA
ncbi:class I SAM-dependent methyltransferase [Sphingosinithalassobacter sp. CS137]|uniref:class I SAM-dependent methyltransferase n=1 Tax=Sphingosinithalassobacter sp. CS137 TaxID=2762748 RepID=UPI00165E69B2|nr:methyltransferase domain-containing protein [Sphingosinithalassobacter sp. CS137]